MEALKIIKMVLLQNLLKAIADLLRLRGTI
jgi:hypothetical protein